MSNRLCDNRRYLCVGKSLLRRFSTEYIIHAGGTPAPQLSRVPRLDTLTIKPYGQPSLSAPPNPGYCTNRFNFGTGVECVPKYQLQLILEIPVAIGAAVAAHVVARAVRVIVCRVGVACIDTW